MHITGMVKHQHSEILANTSDYRFYLH